MAELIVFPDIEAAAIDQLTADLAANDRAVVVADKIPATRPDEFVTIQRVGGPKRDLVTDSPSLMFDCYSDKGSSACTLANMVRAIVHSWRGATIQGVTVYRVVEFAGPQNLPDPRTTQPRYRFTASLDVRGSVI